MAVCRRIAWVFVVALTLASCAAQAGAEAGRWSIGASFGAGVYAGGSLNDSLRAIGYKEVTQGREYGGSVRYRITRRWSIEGEVIALRGKGTTDSIEPRFVARTRGLATPLSLDYQLTQNDSYEFSFFGGAGPMFGAGWTAEQVPNRFESQTRTALYGHAGFEGRLRAGPRFAVTMRALGRIARADDLEQIDDPRIRYGVSMSGFAFSAGLRAWLGALPD